MVGLVASDPDLVEHLDLYQPDVVVWDLGWNPATELEVLRPLAEGLPNKVIAHRLDVTDHEVKFHVDSILDKLGAQSRTEAVITAIRRDLVSI